MSDTPIEQGLRRRLGPILLTLYGLGTIIGAGIWVLVGEVAGGAGLATPAAFVVAALVAGITGLSYAALAAEMPAAGGEVVWLKQAFQQRWLTAATGLAVATTGVVSAATIARGFAGYLGVLAPVPEVLAILLLVVLLAVVAVRGILESAAFAAALTLASLAALGWVVISRAEVLADWPRLVDALPGLSMDLWLPVLGSAFLAFYAFIGFEDMVNVAEEVREPRRNMPIAIIAALILATLVYALVAAVAVLAVPPAELARQPAPLAWVVGRGAQDPLIAIAGLVAVTNSALAQVVMAARILLALARVDLAPAALARVGGRGTPVLGTLLISALVLLLALLEDIGTLARLTSLLVLLVFTAVNVALLVLMRREPGRYRIARTVPVLGALSSTALVLAALAAALR